MSWWQRLRASAAGGYRRCIRSGHYDRETPRAPVDGTASPMSELCTLENPITQWDIRQAIAEAMAHTHNGQRRGASTEPSCHQG